MQAQQSQDATDTAAAAADEAIDQPQIETAESLPETIAETPAVPAILEPAALEGVKDESSTKPAEETSAAPVQVIEPVIETPVVEAPIVEPVAVAAPVATVFSEKSEDTQEPNEELDYIEKMRTEGTEVQKRILAAVETFCEQMKPKAAIVPTKGVGYQYEFLQHLLWLLEKNYDEFRAGWNLLLVYFSVYHGKPTASNYSALSEFSTNRFLPYWTKGEERADAYRNLITLLRATRSRATRKHDIKTIALERVAPNVLTANALDNLKNFYKI